MTNSPRSSFTDRKAPFRSKDLKQRDRRVYMALLAVREPRTTRQIAEAAEMSTEVVRASLERLVCNRVAEEIWRSSHYGGPAYAATAYQHRSE